MSSVRKALRTGEVEKGTYEKLVCSDCGVPLGKSDREAVGWHRICPECGREWKQLP